MPHQDWQHIACCLESFLISRGINPPLYCLGQVVEVLTEVENDDENTSTHLDRGVVVGVTHEQVEFYPAGWVYSVRFETREAIASAPWLPLPHDELSPESELRPIQTG
jgi:hypothetical protein